MKVCKPCIQIWSDYDANCWCPEPAPGEPDHCHAAVLLELANSTDLVQQFIAWADVEWLSLPMAMCALNDALGTRYAVSRLGEWRDGKRAVPDPVRRYMLETGLPMILRQHGISVPKQDPVLIKNLVASLMPPIRG